MDEGMIMPEAYYVHPTSDVSASAIIGKGTKIWQQCQIREDVRIGKNCILSKGVYIDFGVQIGNNVKIQNGISIYHGVTIEDGVFCGPHCVFTNDLQPRSINPDGSLKISTDWELSKTLVCYGASIGAHATIVCGNSIGRWAMVGAGAVVTRNVPDYGLVYGNPARLHGFVCPCGGKLIGNDLDPTTNLVHMLCSKCHEQINIPKDDFALIITI